jgi:3-phosphoshikimate 1-carboxyvinyltransferase
VFLLCVKRPVVLQLPYLCGAMTVLHLQKPDRHLVADVPLDGSKSISNRALIVMALAGANPDRLTGLSTSKDTMTLQRLLQQTEGILNAGDAGTTFRFMTAYLAVQPGTQVLDGSARMRERPIGGLVEALRTLGAGIEYLEKEGYPPLRIGSLPLRESSRPARIEIDGSTSSQFLSALLLIGPYLPGGLELVPVGRLVSRPYLEMTLRLMQSFGAKVEWQGETIVVAPGTYQPGNYAVEADWSAASYWYSMAVFADRLDLKLRGLYANSTQGDAVLSTMMEKFGIQTAFETDGIRLTHSGKELSQAFQWDFLECPDIAQTLAVVCGGMGTPGLFSGLETLSIKETDRIAALKNELKKVNVAFAKLPKRMHQKFPDQEFYLTEGKAQWDEAPEFATYGDHRMAMAFAPLAFLAPIVIEHPEVVAKSYPGFWQHLEQVGFQLAVSTR